MTERQPINLAAIRRYAEAWLKPPRAEPYGDYAHGEVLALVEAVEAAQVVFEQERLDPHLAEHLQLEAALDRFTFEAPE